ncbi:MAG: acetyl-CoA carboxylase, biotin carboxyl carrier protein [Candidatus Melainabacteria bacterium GWF2_37_15]|nr:MAG: acetyl-CoA carboxylase, biotin carboxyl carrier protein [Candidatus Melainabacteria bacterium GWF2_37_15]
MDLEYIEKLVELVSKNELTELTIEEGENAVVIRKEKEVVTTQVAAPAQVMAAPAVVPQAKPEAPKAEAPKGIAITSPMVGTFYRSPSPGAAPFTDAGKTVNIGQVVCIIEAMKLMNEIEAEVAGKVIEICVEDGQPVEFGQTLMIVAP